MAYKEVQNPVNFPQLEKEILEFWESKDVFRKSIESRPEEKPFTFYEGPPTANGKPGIHHVISRCIKDFVCRYKTMQGYRVTRKAGWDTHGLPVEIEVEKSLNLEHKDQIEAYGVAKFNKQCKDSVFKYVSEWNELTRRIGYWVDLKNPYVTYTNDYIETVWWLLSELWKKDLLYRGFKILPHCPRCETALSSHETSLGYKEVSDRAITVKFKIKDKENHFVLAWTTTPWTLPGNVALAVGEEIEYVEVEQDNDGQKEVYYLAESRLEMLEGEYTILRKLKGKDLENFEYEPLFDFVNLTDDDHKAYFVALADFVTTEEGTGVVHTAVMYGEDDYRLGMKIGLPAKHTVDVQGNFNKHVPDWQGNFVKDPETEKAIIIYLKQKGLLYKSEKYTHSYPHCWRCDSPLLYYAKRSWYIKTTAMKDELIKNNHQIDWYPNEVGEGRFGQWLENNVDWAISRDRYWGTPLNIWLCDSCKKQQGVGSVEELKKLSGQDDIEDLHKPYIDEVSWKCSECDGTMHRTPEVIDCWFDSGSMPFAQYHYPFENKELFEKNFPADFIAEGVDQTRGWFYSLLAISTLITGKSSYKSCISIELILDKNGQKMSKSKGNAVEPFKILNKYGADALRWYLYTVSPPWVPTRFDEDGVQEIIRKFFGTLTNTWGFYVLYANIDGFSYDKESPIDVKDRPEIDRWLISTLNQLVRDVDNYLQRHDITKAARTIQEFVIDDLSNWYIRQNRRRFWKAEMGDDKSAAYQTLYETLFTVAKMIAPFSPFLAESIYQSLNQDGYEDEESVHLAQYPNPSDANYTWMDDSLMFQMNTAKEVVSLCRAARNDAAIRVRQPLGRVIIHTNGEKSKEAIQYFESLILKEVNIRKVEFTDSQADLVELKAKPNFKKLGPRYGSHVNQAGEIIRGFSQDEIQKLQVGETLHITLDNGKHGDVLLEDIEIIEEPINHLVVQTYHDLTVAIDTKLNEDLVSEGLAREFINRIQNMRKDAGFEITDRISVFYEASSILHRAIRTQEEHISDEVLAVHLTDQFKETDIQKEFKIEKETVRVSIEKSS